MTTITLTWDWFAFAQVVAATAIGVISGYALGRRSKP